MTSVLPKDSIAQLSPSPSSLNVPITVKPSPQYQSTVARTSGTWIIGTTFSPIAFSSTVRLGFERCLGVSARLCSVEVYGLPIRHGVGNHLFVSVFILLMMQRPG